MENWLKEQGYVKENYWEDGERLAYHGTNDNFLAPYLDGGEKRVTTDVGNKCVVIDSEGEYICDQTGGCPTEINANTFECACCGDDTDDDDGYWVERGEDVRVCESCLNNEYTYVYGRRGNQYYVHQDNAVYVDSQSEYYDEDYLSDNEIIQLECGEYAPMDEAVEINGDWYSIDDDRICRFEDTDEYGLTEDGWQCEDSCNWYTDDCTDWVEIANVRYHKDNAPEQDDHTSEPTPDATLLTMSMLDQLALFEDYGIELNLVRFSMCIRHDGNRLYAHRDLTTHSIALHGLDNTRISMRKILSTELMHMASINANIKLEATDTI
jgi:hypothetical protein